MRVIQYERDLLISIEFQFNLSHPHNLIIKLAHSLQLSKPTANKAWDLLNKWYEEEDFVLWNSCEELAMRALKESSETTCLDDKKALLVYCNKNKIKI